MTQHAASGAVRGARQGLHDRGAGPAVGPDGGPGLADRTAGPVVQHHAAAVPEHAGPHARGAPIVVRPPRRPHQGLLPARPLLPP